MPTYLSEQDVQDYGVDLINLTQRSALHAVAPALQEIQQQNEVLRQQVAKEARHRLDQQVAAAVPGFREIDRNPDWHRWLLGVDALSGEIRQRLLNAAIQRGDSSSVIAFFKGFERESGGAQAPSAPSGRNRAPPSGRIYSRDEIARLYEANRKGLCLGRESEWAKQEADLFDAQKEGRVRGLPYLTK